MARERSNHRWEELREAGRRLGRHAGHLRRVCPLLEAAGLARKVKGGGLKARWQIRRDAELPVAELAAAERPPRSIVLTVGDTSIRISAAASVTLHISPAGRQAGGKRSRTPFDGRSTAN